MSDAGAGVEHAPARARTSAPGSDPLTRIVFALLVIACFAAFFITQRLKHTPTVVQSFELTPFFSPFPSGHIKQEAISFKLARAEEVTVTVIDSRGNTVATLVHDYPAPRYKQFSLRWNGRRGSAHRYLRTRSPRGLAIVEPVTDGARAPAGEYRVRVGLRKGSSVLSPLSFTLVDP